MTNAISRRSVLLPALLLVALAASACTAIAEGRRAPAVAGERWLLLEGKDASAVVEGKWGLVVFFRPHLPDCNADFGLVLELADTYGPRGLVTVAVTPDDAEAARTFILRHQVPFPVLAEARPTLDAWGIPDMWGNRIYLVNPSGVVVAQDDVPETRRILEKWMPR